MVAPGFTYGTDSVGTRRRPGHNFHEKNIFSCLQAKGALGSPRGNLMEEGMGVPAGGGRRESWAPPDVGSAHPAERAFTVYRFRPGPACPAAVALPSVRRFLTVRTCVLGPV
jgi:hypothetical protein